MKTATRLHMIGLPIMLATLLTFLASIPVGASSLTGAAVPRGSNLHPHVAAPADTAMLTYKNDTSHSGLNPHETILTPSNVNALQFGKQVSYGVDGQVYAQPLFMPNVTIGANTYNVAFVTTEHDSVYAFDADQVGASKAPLWHTSFLVNGATAVSPNDVSCGDLSPEIGITSTPVIDPATNTIYTVAFTKENGNLVWRLHALDITTGHEKSGSPTVITTSGFNTHFERQRSNLLLSQGQVYVAFASFCDNTPYHGYVLSYSSSTLQQTHAYNDTPSGGLGGIWGGDGTMTADSSGNIYLMTGNGTFDLNTGGPDGGDSFLKLSPSLNVIDYFTPFNTRCLEAVDADLGSGGPLVLPSLNELMGAGKEGRIYVMSMTAMGHFRSILNPCGNQGGSNDTQIKQELPPHMIGSMFSTPSTWTSANGRYVYFGSVDHPIQAFRLNGNGLLTTPPSSQTPQTFGWPGENTVVSSNGNTAGILWAIGTDDLLHAYDASNLGHELYNSGFNPGRDALTGAHVKFSTLTVANGEVFVGTKGALNIYSELPNTAGNNYNNVGVSDDANPGSGNFDGTLRSYSAQALASVGVTPGNPVAVNGFSFQWPNVQAGTPDNWLADGQTLPVTPVNNANVLGILGAADNGAASGTATMHFGDGTSQDFTLGFTDWWQPPTVLFNNVVAEVAPYQNASTGKVSHTATLYLAQVIIPTGEVIQSVTLPSNVTGGQLHVFAISTENSSTANAFNNAGISNDTATSAGNFDGTSRSYSAQALASVGVTPGNPVTVNGFSFQWPNVQAGTSDNWQANGQAVSVTPVNGADVLGILGAATFGGASGTATVHFTDGTSQTFTLGFTDWWQPPTVLFNNVVAKIAPYQNASTGKVFHTATLYLAQVSIPSGKVIQSVTLPLNVTGGQLHVFAISTENSSTANGFNNAGISNDTATNAGNFDGGGRSYSAQALASVGVTPGNPVTVNGFSFQWPNVQPGTPDNWQANGQTLSVTPVNGATTLGILGAATFGAASGTMTVNFTDGTSQTFTLGFTDWWQPPTVSFNNVVAKTAPYQNASTGKVFHTATLYLAQVSIPAGKVVQSVTLPANVTGGQLHVFSISTK